MRITTEKWTWFSSRNTVGIVVVKLSNGERKAYIGCAQGYDEKSDVRAIADFGCEFPIEVADMLIS